MIKEDHNIARALPLWANKTPDKIAVCAPIKRGQDQFEYEELSFSDLNSRSLFYAYAFRDKGLVPGDKVLMFAKPSVDFSAMTFSLFRLGLVPIFIDPGMGRKNLLRAVEHIKPDAMVAEPIVHLLAFLFPKAFKTIRVIYTTGRFSPGKLESIAALRRQWNNQNKPLLAKIMYPCEKDTMAAILFTSGGTGIPKAVHYNHGIFNAQVSRLQELFQLSPDDIDLPGFPLFSLFTITMGMKSAIPFMNPSKPGLANPKNLVQNIKDNKATFVAGSPAIWQNMVKYCLNEQITLPSVKYLVMFGAPVPNNLHRDFKKILTHGDTYTPYGATECLPVANISGSQVLALYEGLSPGLKNKGISTCVGLPVAQTQIKIAPISDGIMTDSAQINWKSTGETGEVCVYSETVTPEYIGMQEKTEQAKIKDPRGGLWHRMGDLGFLDEEGRLWFSGRLTHRIELNGKTVPCVPQESIYNELEAIKRCAFVGPVVNGKPSPTLVVQLKNKLALKEQQELKAEIFRLDKEGNDLIDNIIFIEKLPVDVRHNIKIDRIKLKKEIETGALT